VFKINDQNSKNQLVDGDRKLDISCLSFTDKRNNAECQKVQIIMNMWLIM